MARLTLILGVLATVIYLLDGFRFLLNEWRNWRNKVTWLSVMGILLIPSISYAVNAITPGVVVVTATFQSISVTAPYTGDDNANATVSVQFKKTTGDSNHDAYTPYLDRRATIGGAGNPYVNQARGGIVGLVENTSYDVQVTWSDPDGITGGQPAVQTISTLTSTPPIGSGTPRSIIDNASMATALGAANPGDTLTWASGSYNAFTLSRSGNAGAWIVLDGAGVATISGLGVNQNIALNANYIILKNFIASDSDFHGIVLGGSQHDLFVSNNTVQGFSRLCADGPTTTHNEDTGIAIGVTSSNIYVMNNMVTGHANLIACLQVPSYAGPGQGIGFSSCTTCVVAGNTIIGNGVRDALDVDSSSSSLVNMDIYNNTLSGYMDDGVEFKGENLNVRSWGNIVTQDGNGTVGGNTCMSNESTLGTNLYGPSYYFRNTCKIIRSVGLCAYKGPSGPLYYFHNSLDATGVAGQANWAYACGAASAGSGPYVTYNNASIVSASMMERAPGDSLFDYNVGTAGGTYSYQWNNATDYTTFADFQAGTGQEVHGLSTNPLFADSALHLSSGSPSIDRGLVLANFNTADSLWPFSGSAPDVGAYEFQSSQSSPVVIARVIRWMEILLPVIGLGWHCRRALAMGAATMGRYGLVLSRVMAAISYRSCLFTLQIATTAMKARNNR